MVAVSNAIAPARLKTPSEGTVRGTDRINHIRSEDDRHAVDQDVVDILTTDHHEVLDLLQQIKITTDAEERRDLADTVISELVRHWVAEEKYIYPAMQKSLPDGDEAVDHDVEEHKELEQTMKKLESVDAQSGEFAQLLRDWRTSFAIMSATRRMSSFQSCGSRCPGRSSSRLGARGESEEAGADPAASIGTNNEVFHKLVGPGVGLVDRLRDKSTDRSS